MSLSGEPNKNVNKSNERINTTELTIITKKQDSDSEEDEIANVDAQEEMEELYRERFDVTVPSTHDNVRDRCPELRVTTGQSRFGSATDEEKSITIEETFKGSSTRPKPDNNSSPKRFLICTNCVCGLEPCVRLRYCGLENLGFTCYSNSVVQLLYQTPQLRNYFIEKTVQLGPFHEHLVRLFDYMECQAARGLHEVFYAKAKPKDFNKTFRQVKSDFSLGQQHDAQEFLTVLIELVHQEANRAKKRDQFVEPKSAQEAWDDHLAHIDDSYLSSILMGQVESILSCATCGHQSKSWSSFWQLQLQILPDDNSKEAEKQPPMTIHDGIQEYTAEEILADDAAPFCSKCAQRRTASKRQSFCRVPKVLLVHLKRFTATGAKINRIVDIADQLELAGVNFQLHSVIVHHGNETNGHYFTLVRQSDKHWASFDDTIINDEIVSAVAHESELRRFAYLCLYNMKNQVTYS